MEVSPVHRAPRRSIRTQEPGSHRFDPRENTIRALNRIGATPILFSLPRLRVVRMLRRLYLEVRVPGQVFSSRLQSRMFLRVTIPNMIPEAPISTKITD